MPKVRIQFPAHAEASLLMAERAERMESAVSSHRSHGASILSSINHRGGLSKSDWHAVFSFLIINYIVTHFPAL